MGAAQNGSFHALGRVMVDRRLAGGGLLFAAAERFPLAARRDLVLTAKPPHRTARTARLEMRFGRVEIARSPNEKDRSLPKSVALSLVEVKEVSAPAGEEPVHWRLLSTHGVEDTAMAWRLVGWYQARWQIEQLFRTLKSQGLRLEDSQVGSAARLEKLAAAAMKAACITMQLVQERDGAHGLPPSAVFGAGFGRDH